MAELSGDRFQLSRVASGDLSGSQYRFLLLSGRDVYLSATSGETVFGVLQDKPRDDEHARIATMGQTKITVGESLGTNAFVMTNDSGYAILASSGQYVPGRLTTGADSGMIGEMQLTFTGSGI